MIDYGMIICKKRKLFWFSLLGNLSLWQPNKPVSSPPSSCCCFWVKVTTFGLDFLPLATGNSSVVQANKKCKNCKMMIYYSRLYLVRDILLVPVVLSDLDWIKQTLSHCLLLQVQWFWWEQNTQTTNLMGWLHHQCCSLHRQCHTIHPGPIPTSAFVPHRLSLSKPDVMN